LRARRRFPDSFADLSDEEVLGRLLELNRARSAAAAEAA
jgi:hypothetical protein